MIYLQCIIKYTYTFSFKIFAIIAMTNLLKKTYNIPIIIDNHIIINKYNVSKSESRNVRTRSRDEYYF